MIVSLEGRLVECGPLRAVIAVGGVGYEVHIPLPTASQLPAIGGTVRLHTYAVYREDAQTLYGFHEIPLRDFFRLLIEKVSGVGPKIALGILSRLSLTTLQSALASGDVALLSKCQGIGKKTAERLVVELKDKMSAFSPGPLFTPHNATDKTGTTRLDQDAILALISLGFKPADADKAIRLALEKLGAEAPTAALIRQALN